MRAKDGMMWGMEWDSPGNSAAALVTVPLRLQPYYVMQLGRWLQVSSFAPKQRPLHSNPCVLRNAGALGPWCPDALRSWEGARQNISLAISRERFRQTFAAKKSPNANSLSHLIAKGLLGEGNAVKANECAEPQNCQTGLTPHHRHDPFRSAWLLDCSQQRLIAQTATLREPNLQSVHVECLLVLQAGCRKHGCHAKGCMFSAEAIVLANP